MTRQKKALQEFKKQERANLKASKATENAEIKMRKRRQAGFAPKPKNGQNLDYKNDSKTQNDSRGKRMANPITISAQSKFVWDLTNVSQNLSSILILVICLAFKFRKAT